MKSKKGYLLFSLLVAITLTVINTQPARTAGYEPPAPPSKPAAGSWSWDNEDVTGTIIPQYQLAPTFDGDYALLQSEGVHLSGGAQICHPYPGGQFGWKAQIRVLTKTGWQQVPTVNAWVPDEEGKFMTCAQANYSGTYAIFGYWEKYAGYKQCPVPGFTDFAIPVDELWFATEDGRHDAVGCGADGSLLLEPAVTDQEILDLLAELVYCCNGNVYRSDNPEAGN